jgi:prepilin-type processing-associated H-X9-DG protein
MPDKEFDAAKPALTSCYAYPLGYVVNGILHGPRIDSDECNSAQPLLADKPPLNVADGDPGHSPNHGQRGGNVLYQDGSCRYVKTRYAGCDGDDIYLNRELKVKPGTDRKDAVLAGSDVLP